MSDNVEYVKDIINAWDPIALLPLAPDNEYHSEIAEIQRMLSETDVVDELAEGILKLFIKSFGEKIFSKDKAECEQIARMLLFQKSIAHSTGNVAQGDSSVC